MKLTELKLVNKRPVHSFSEQENMMLKKGKILNFYPKTFPFQWVFINLSRFSSRQWFDLPILPIAYEITSRTCIWGGVSGKNLFGAGQNET